MNNEVICTRLAPWDKVKRSNFSIVHPDAKCVSSYENFYNDYSYDEYECPHCNERFKVELGQ